MLIYFHIKCVYYTEPWKYVKLSHFDMVFSHTAWQSSLNLAFYTKIVQNDGFTYWMIPSLRFFRFPVDYSWGEIRAKLNAIWCCSLLGRRSYFSPLIRYFKMIEKSNYKRDCKVDRWIQLWFGFAFGVGFIFGDGIQRADKSKRNRKRNWNLYEKWSIRHGSQ